MTHATASMSRSSDAAGQSADRQDGFPVLAKRAAGFAAALSAAALMVLASSPAAQAIPVPGVQARAIVAPNFSCPDPGCAPVDDIEEASSGPQHAEGSAIGGFDGSGSASADVDFGAMHLFAHFLNSGHATGYGENRDLLTFTAPGVATGTLIQVTFKVLVDGNSIEGGAGGGQGRWALQADLGGGVFDINAGAQNDVINGYVGDAFGLFSATVTIQAGFEAPLAVELTGTAIASSGGEATADLGDSLYWGGITGVSVGGVALDEFTVTSASGTDWAQSFVPASTVPVPAPGGGLIFVGGLAALGMVRRRRQALP